MTIDIAVFRDGFNASRVDHIKCGQKPGAKWNLTELIPYSRQKNISLSFPVHDNSQVTHLSHNSPFRFLPSHASRSWIMYLANCLDLHHHPLPVLLLHFFLLKPCICVSKKHRTAAIIIFMLSLLSGLVGGPSCSPQQLADLSLLSRYIDPERSLNSIIRFSHAPQFPWSIISIVDFISSLFWPTRGHSGLNMSAFNVLRGLVLDRPIWGIFQKKTKIDSTLMPQPKCKGYQQNRSILI